MGVWLRFNESQNMRHIILIDYIERIRWKKIEELRRLVLKQPKVFDKSGKP
jgi:hypothetical protein